jgi:hypothetical protein
MKFELLLGVTIPSLILVVWSIRLLSRRDVLIHLLFVFAAISYLVRHFTDSKAI